MPPPARTHAVWCHLVRQPQAYIVRCYRAAHEGGSSDDLIPDHIQSLEAVRMEPLFFNTNNVFAMLLELPDERVIVFRDSTNVQDGVYSLLTTLTNYQELSEKNFAQTRSNAGPVPLVRIPTLSTLLTNLAGALTDYPTTIEDTLDRLYAAADQTDRLLETPTDQWALLLSQVRGMLQVNTPLRDIEHILESVKGIRRLDRLGWNPPEPLVPLLDYVDILCSILIRILTPSLDAAIILLRAIDEALNTTSASLTISADVFRDVARAARAFRETVGFAEAPRADFTALEPFFTVAHIPDVRPLIETMRPLLDTVDLTARGVVLRALAVAGRFLVRLATLTAEGQGANVQGFGLWIRASSYQVQGGMIQLNGNGVDQNSQYVLLPRVDLRYAPPMVHLGVYTRYLRVQGALYQQLRQSRGQLRMIGFGDAGVMAYMAAADFAPLGSAVAVTTFGAFKPGNTSFANLVTRVSLERYVLGRDIVAELPTNLPTSDYVHPTGKILLTTTAPPNEHHTLELYIDALSEES